jgi:outer membrane protein
MKRFLLSGVAGSLICASSAFSATILGFGVEADYYKPVSSGHFGYNGGMQTTTEFSNKSNDSYQIGVYLEHPVPLLPNIRLDYTPMKFSSTARIDNAKSKAGFVTGATATSDVQLNALDVTPYYEILDNVVSLDIGITARNISSTIDTKSGGASSSDSVSATLPMLYVAAEVKLPFTGLKANADIRYLGLKENKYMDAKAKLTYNVFNGLGIEGGYRYQQLKLKEFDIDADVIFKGPFVGVNYHF